MNTTDVYELGTLYQRHKNITDKLELDLINISDLIGDRLDKGYSDDLIDLMMTHQMLKDTLQRQYEHLETLNAILQALA